MLKNPVAVVIGAMLLVALVLAATLLVRPEAERSAGADGQAAREIRVLRFGHNIPVDSALHQAALRFAERVAERSAGKLVVEVYPAQQLGTDEQMLEMARQGELDILLTPTAKISTAVPAMQYVDLPFYFPTREALYAMLDGEPGQMLLGKLRAIDLVGVTFWENGFKHFTAHHAVRAPEDFSGLDVRIMKSRLLAEQFAAFGAHTIPIDFHATRQALADGVVDAQENPLIAIVSMGLHEVQSHLTLSSHGYMGYVFMISGRVFDALPAELQSLLVDSAREITPWERDETHRREVALLAQIAAAGVTVHTLSDAERAQFAAATAHIPGMFEEVIGPDLLARTEELLFERNPPAEAILIGLDADLSQDCWQGGMALRRGAALAVEEINARGGVLGRPLHLLVRNHKAMVNAGLRNIENFAAQSQLVAVLGGAHSSVAVAQVDFARRTGLPLLLTWSAAAELTESVAAGDPVFRVSANDALAVPYMLEHVLGVARRPALIYEQSTWGRAGQTRLRAEMQARGQDLALAEGYSRGETMFEPLVERLLGKGADAVVLVGTPDEVGRILDVLAARAPGLPVVSHWGITCGDFWAEHGGALSALDLRFFQTFSFADSPRPAARALGEAYRVRYGARDLHRVRAPHAVAQAYDAVHLIAAALEVAGVAERGALRTALENLPPHEGAVRRYAPAFTADRHDALDRQDYHMARFDAEGRIVAVQAGRGE